MEGAAQEAAGEGQELGWGTQTTVGGGDTRQGVGRWAFPVFPSTLGASSRYCDPEPMVMRRGKLLSCST